MAKDEWAERPYTWWLEEAIQTLMLIDPAAIAMELIAEDGAVQTCYYNVSPDDRAIIMDAMRDDAMYEWVRNHAKEIAELLSGELGEEEDEDGDELQGTDPEADSEE